MPSPTATGTGLRAAGRLLLSAQVAHPSEIKQLLALMAQLSALTDAVVRLRQAQDRAGQARAARHAAEALRAVMARYTDRDVPLVAAAAPAPTSSGLGGAARAAEPERPYGAEPDQFAQVRPGSQAGHR